ncbi:MAG: TrmH family RNA methyltransferase, partial [Candidatus Zixiibacteriota bacterium]
LSPESMSILILAIGSESDGLSEEVLKLADYKFSIRHSPRVESLNAAVAGSILMRAIYQNSDKKGS